MRDPGHYISAKDGYLVLKANVNVTLVMTRLRLILHRDKLLDLIGPACTQRRNGAGCSYGRDQFTPDTDPFVAAELVTVDLGENLDWRHEVYGDLFKTVHGYVTERCFLHRMMTSCSIPIHAVRRPPHLFVRCCRSFPIDSLT